MQTSLTVSIINYRTAALTIAAVKSVLADIGDLNVHVVVTDNASGDGSADEIAAWLADQPEGTPVTLVRSENNTGFSGGHNIGIHTKAADYYLVLNSDAVLQAGFLKIILTAAEAAPEIGFFAPQICYDDGTVQNSCFRFHSPAGELIRSARNGLITRIFGHRDVALGAHPSPEQIEWASFACILLRGKMVDQLGPMDEGYFLYFEDAEYCLRARRKNWRIMQVPEARAVHYRGGSGPVKSLANARKRLPAYYYASRTRFLTQAHGRSGLLLANLNWYLGRAIAWASRALGRNYSALAKSEARDIWTNFTQPLGPRRAPHDTL